MAQFPQGLRQIESRCNAGERRVLDQLRQCLDDQHIVWHDLPVGEAARQPDFIVLGPGLGLLLLEVKDWKLATIRQATPDRVELATASGPVMTAHPLRQVRDHAMALADLLQRDPALVHDDGPHRGRLALRYGWGAVMSNLRRAEVAALPGFDAVFPPARTLLRDDLDDSVDPETFVQRLSGLFTVDLAQRLTPAQRERIRWHLFPELRLGEPAPAPAAMPPETLPEVPDLLQVMDLQQEQVARTLGDGHRVIHGVAGSGKTMILVHRARLLAREAEPARPVLVLCYNRALADRIEALVAPDEPLRARLQVRTFHGWCAELARRHRIAVPAPPEGQDDADAPARLAQAVIAAADAGRVPLGGHHAVLIDEAHDFEDDWLRLAAAMTDPAARRLLVLYDDAQSIYQRLRRRFSFTSVGIQARGRTSVLRLNYRNTAEVLGLALRFARGLLPERGRDREAGRDDEDDRVTGVAPSSSGRRGPRPVLIRARSAHEEAELLAARIADAVVAGTPLGEIAVLCRTRAQMAPIAEALARRGLPLQSMGSAGFQHFDWSQAGIRLVTLHSAKGLEFAHVHVAGLQRLPWRDETLEDAVRLVYVAMTRATQSLVLSCCGSSPVVERLQAALQEQGLESALQ
ncbi:DNA helicase [Sphaerotilus sp. FB-3]|uniref:3'-5' exonuclease n=1 Tax=Sphaerotilus sp. FB-3 TaxID=2913396 RepID=UPI002041354C|nr:NERD domain-containing protein/DEAD/DEAH box helicase [Sphaerotilus sp. FB-3]GKQ58521.1 DNA helicase [Sphaerotilus sp. FB-3]